MTESSTALGDWIALSDYSLRILDISISELATIKAMQAGMAETISDNVRGLHSGLSEGEQEGHLAALVAATQMEDPLRQRLEHVMAALAVLKEALDERQREARSQAGTIEVDRERLERLAWRVVEPQTLGDVRAAFARALGIEAERPETASDSGDVDLF